MWFLPELLWVCLETDDLHGCLSSRSGAVCVYTGGIQVQLKVQVNHVEQLLVVLCLNAQEKRLKHETQVVVLHVQ